MTKVSARFCTRSLMWSSLAKNQDNTMAFAAVTSDETAGMGAATVFLDCEEALLITLAD